MGRTGRARRGEGVRGRCGREEEEGEVEGEGK